MFCYHWLMMSRLFFLLASLLQNWRVGVNVTSFVSHVIDFIWSLWWFIRCKLAWLSTNTFMGDYHVSFKSKWCECPLLKMLACITCTCKMTYGSLYFSLINYILNHLAITYLKDQHKKGYSFFTPFSIPHLEMKISRG